MTHYLCLYRQHATILGASGAHSACRKSSPRAIVIELPDSLAPLRPPDHQYIVEIMGNVPKTRRSKSRACCWITTARSTLPQPRGRAHQHGPLVLASAVAPAE